MRRHEWRSSGSVHWVSGPKSLLSPCTTMTLREVEAPRGHRASPIVLHFKTDKHLLIKAGQRALFLRKKWGKVVPTSAIGQKDFWCVWIRVAYITNQRSQWLSFPGWKDLKYSLSSKAEFLDVYIQCAADYFALTCIYGYYIIYVLTVNTRCFVAGSFS